MNDEEELSRLLRNYAPMYTAIQVIQQLHGIG